MNEFWLFASARLDLCRKLIKLLYYTANLENTVSRATFGLYCESVGRDYPRGAGNRVVDRYSAAAAAAAAASADWRAARCALRAVPAARSRALTWFQAMFRQLSPGAAHVNTLCLFSRGQTITVIWIQRIKLILALTLTLNLTLLSLMTLTLALQTRTVYRYVWAYLFCFLGFLFPLFTFWFGAVH